MFHSKRKTAWLVGLSAATIMGGGIVAAQAQAASSNPPAQTIGDFFMCADSGSRAVRLAWSWTACPSGTTKYVVPQAHGTTGATGARGPSDLYPGTTASPLVVGDTASTFDTASVPAGSYQVQFSAVVNTSTAAQNIVCAVFPSSGPPRSLPDTRATLTSSVTAEVPISAVGWYVAAADTTFALTCAVSGTGQTAMLGSLSMTALQVATIH
jgi:hypothetical protein